MKRISIFFLFTIIALSACKKENGPAPNSNPQLVIGYTLDYPPFASHMYLITNTALYVDSNASSVINYSFTSTAMASVKFQLASPLLINFPSYLMDSTSIHVNDSLLPLGMGSMHLEYTRNGHTVKWNIPPDTAYIPTQIRAYVQQVNTVFPKL